MTTDSNSAKMSYSPEEADHLAWQPPVAQRETVEHVLHGDRRLDEYAWLRHKSDPRVLEYLNQENAYADQFLKPTEKLQETLYQEMLGRILQTDLSVPSRLRGYSYYSRTEEGKQYAIYCRRAESALGAIDGSAPFANDTPEEILLDLNVLAEGHSFLGLGCFEVSDDNQHLAYATDTTGFRQYTLEVLDLGTREALPFRVARVTSVAWSADDRVLFYVVEEETTKRSHRLFRHVLGTEQAADRLIYEEKDERFRIDIERTRSGAYLLLVANSHTTSEVRFLRADQPYGDFHVVAVREDEHEYSVDHHPGSSADPAGGVFFVRTNSNGRTFRLMTAPTADPARARWHEVVPNRPGVMLSAIACFRTHLVLCEREDGLPYFRIVDLTREARSALAASHRIDFAEPAYHAAFGANPEFDTEYLRFSYESFITPRSVYDYEVKSGNRILRKQQPVLGGYDPTLYGSERLHAVAQDGTRIPLSVVYRHATPRDGTAALLLYAYGSYGISMPVTFNSNRLSLLDRGVIFVIAHIRGGGELGKPWHDMGRMHQKMNTFTDFIASAEHLIEHRYTSKETLAIEGGSAGGLLMGAVANFRPDLFRLIVSHVPFVDVLNTMLDPSLPLTVGEYEEWGNPQVEQDYFYMKRYCPYTNLEKKEYPAMLVKTGLNDSQVMYWEPAKYVAKLRTLKTGRNPLLFKVNMGAGHGGASGRYDYLREVALDYAFLLTEMGIES
ncbi:MAG TPA: S9 family peptidase [Candidatus Acidoferrum sp.]|nr:S9 family peptidase [Candidatus Acidoferrum sp.]